MLGLAAGIRNTSYQWQPYMVGADMKMWLRNNVGITAAQWDDSSGTGNHISQSTGALQVDSITDGGFDFEGDNEEYYNIEHNITIAEEESFAVFLVVKLESFDSQNTILGTGDNNVLLEFQTDRRIRLKTDQGTDIIQYAAETFKAAEKMLVGITRGSGGTGAWALYKNGSGVAEDSTPTGDGNNTGAFAFNKVGMRHGGDRFFDGIIYEMIVYDSRDLKAAEISKINNYLKNKHGL